LLDVGVDDVSLWIVDRPAWPTWQRQLGDHTHRVEPDDRGGAVFAQGLTEIEAVELAPLSVVGEPVRVRPNLDLPVEFFVRAGEDADTRGSAVTREEQVLLLIDQDAGDAGQFRRKRVQVGTGVAVEYLDPVGARVGNVEPPALPVDVGVVEAGVRPGRDRDEADPGETHLSCFRRRLRPRSCTKRRARRRPAATTRAGGG